MQALLANLHSRINGFTVTLNPILTTNTERFFTTKAPKKPQTRSLRLEVSTQTRSLKLEAADSTPQTLRSRRLAASNTKPQTLRSRRLAWSELEAAHSTPQTLRSLTHRKPQTRSESRREVPTLKKRNQGKKSKKRPRASTGLPKPANNAQNTVSFKVICLFLTLGTRVFSPFFLYFLTVFYYFSPPFPPFYFPQPPFYFIFWLGM